MKIFILNLNLSKNPFLSTTTWGQHIKRLGGVLVYSIFVCVSVFFTCFTFYQKLFDSDLKNWKVFPRIVVVNLSRRESFFKYLVSEYKHFVPRWSPLLELFSDALKEHLWRRFVVGPQPWTQLLSRRLSAGVWLLTAELEQSQRFSKGHSFK